MQDEDGTFPGGRGEGVKRKLTEEEVRGLFTKCSRGGSNEAADKGDYLSASDQAPPPQVGCGDGAVDDAAALHAPSSGSVCKGATVNVGGVPMNPWGMGTLPLSVAYPDPTKRPKEAAAISIILEALDAGCQFFDTADTYCPDPPNDFHYCERLLCRALE